MHILLQWLYSYSIHFAVSGKFVYGADIRAVGQPTEEGMALVDSTTTLTSVIVQFAVKPPFYKLFPTKLYREIVAAYQVCVYVCVCVCV